jgi:hypothetical protein
VKEAMNAVSRLMIGRHTIAAAASVAMFLIAVAFSYFTFKLHNFNSTEAETTVKCGLEKNASKNSRCIFGFLAVGITFAAVLVLHILVRSVSYSHISNTCNMME